VSIASNELVVREDSLRRRRLAPVSVGAAMKRHRRRLKAMEVGAALIEMVGGTSR